MDSQKSAITITTEDVITVVEAAKALEKHIATIYRWHDAGRIIGIKFGGVLFIPRSEIKRLKRDKGKG